jgi:hypothetical protein
MIETYKVETEKKKAEIEDLGTKPSVFQAQRCQACNLQLDLPTVHFLCKHSFHQRFARSLLSKLRYHLLKTIQMPQSS